MRETENTASELAIVSWKDSEGGGRLARLAQWLGLDPRIVEVEGEFSCLSRLQELRVQGSLAMSMDAATLGHLFEDARGRESLKRFLFSRISHLFIYGFKPGRQENLIEYLTDGRLTGLRPVTGEGLQYRVNPDARDFSRQLTGLEFGPVNRLADSTFAPGSGEGWASLVSIADSPFLVELRKEDCRLCLAGVSQTLDIGAPAPRGFSIRENFSQLFPAMMFLRHAFGARCWHAPRPRASLIIDDPLLQECYGFLRYRDLLEVMDRHDFCTTVAFIPWNYKRSDSAVAKLFRQRNDRFSLVVHGCDHTGGEFGSDDVSDMERKARTAWARMLSHRERTGVDCEACFVFPQGIFSKAAMAALRNAGFLAAVNSTPYAIDGHPDDLRVRDHLDVAIMSYSSFPIFVRRYPREIADFALDLFLGKPAIIVEHHEFFREGFEAVVDLVRKLYALEPELSWSGLGESVRGSALQRLVEGGAQVKSYAAAGGAPTPELNSLLLNSAFHRRARVFIRRRLSEARDNHLSRSRILLGFVEKLRGALSRTPGERR